MNGAPKAPRLPLCLPAVGLAGILALGACSGSPASKTGTLNYAELVDGKTCQGGGNRPCFSPLRSAPSYESPLINKVIDAGDGTQTVVWPFEGYAGSKADVITIVCQVRGDMVRESNVWNVVETKPEHIAPAALAEITAGRLIVGHETNDSGEITKVFPMLPDYWVEGHGVSAKLPVCTPEQNPNGFVPVK